MHVGRFRAMQGVGAAAVDDAFCPWLQGHILFSSMTIAAQNLQNGLLP